MGAKADKKIMVVKIGSSTLVTKEGSVDESFLDHLAEQLQAIREIGWQPIVVSSGAIACGLKVLGQTKRPEDMPSLQAAASVGSSELAQSYAKAFGKFDMLTSLVLLTRRDTADRTAYLHARDTLQRLLELGVVPVVNENDTVSVEQIRFGDNDTLAALVSCLVDADMLVLFSDIDGLYDDNPSKNPDAKLIPLVTSIDPDILGAAQGPGSAVGSGGMITKVRAARILMTAGIPMVICEGHRSNAVLDVAKGESVGTLFAAHEVPHEITPKKLWIALGDSARGSLVVDDGAKRALISKGSSLLVVGVKKVDGKFEAGDVVDIRDSRDFIVARGKVAFSSDEVELACGRSREEITSNRLLAGLAEKPIVHRDELVVFE